MVYEGVVVAGGTCGWLGADVAVAAARDTIQGNKT